MSWLSEQSRQQNDRVIEQYNHNFGGLRAKQYKPKRKPWWKRTKGERLLYKAEVALEKQFGRKR